MRAVCILATMAKTVMHSMLKENWSQLAIGSFVLPSDVEGHCTGMERLVKERLYTAVAKEQDHAGLPVLQSVLVWRMACK